MKTIKAIMLFAMIAGMVLVTFSCQTCPFTKPKAHLEVIPAETFLSPALIRKPVSFSGSGFAPKEMVSVEMVLPPGLEMKGVNPGEDVLAPSPGYPKSTPFPEISRKYCLP